MTEELRQNLTEISASYRRLADWLDALSNLVVAPSEAEPELPGITEPAPEPEKPSVTFEELRGFLAGKSRDGFTGEVKELITSFGADKLSEITPERYEALLEKAKEIGDAG